MERRNLLRFVATVGGLFTLWQISKEASVATGIGLTTTLAIMAILYYLYRNREI